MTAPEEPVNGPVIRDNRRIDPVTGQPRRGKHAASQPAGGSASRPGGSGAARHGKDGDKGSAPADAVSSQEDKPAESAAAPATAAPAAAAPAAGPQEVQLRVQLAERTADLQRLQAEYANYRKRVDRDRAIVREQAVASALTELLPALDAI